MNRYNRSDKPDWVPPRSIKLLDQVRERIRYLHYSLQTEKAYVYWAKAFVLWAARSGGAFRHPREMGRAEVEGSCWWNAQPAGCPYARTLRDRFADRGRRAALGRNELSNHHLPNL